MHETLGCAIELLIMAEEWFSKPQIFEYMGGHEGTGLEQGIRPSSFRKGSRI